MTCLKVLFCHLFLLALALSSPVDSKIKEKKSNAEVTTPKGKIGAIVEVKRKEF